MIKRVIDIGAKHGGSAGALSNFTSRKFMFDDVECASPEGLLQALKFDKFHVQVEVCKLTGIAAKRRGKERNRAWTTKQVLWWNNVEFPRHSKEYQELLDRIYIAIARQSEAFCAALLDTGEAKLTHTIGRSRESDTVLTSSEFCNRLEKLRSLLVKKVDLNRVTKL